MARTFALFGAAIGAGLLTLVSATPPALATGTASVSRSMTHAGSTSCDATLPAGTVVGIAATADDGGYWIANNEGLVVACGDATDFGNLTLPPDHPIVGIASTPDGGGFYLVASDGGVFTFGDAAFQGSTGALSLNKPIVGMAVDPTTGGYWLVASDGGIFTFNAPFYGSTGAMILNKPVVGMAESNGGSGYWLVASDGGIFAFNALFYGSTGALQLNRPMVGMASDLATGGYWLVASDGGIFSFNAPFYGSTGGIVLNRPIVGMEFNSSGTGYRFVASDGGVFDFGSSGFFGSAVAPIPVAQSCSVSLSNGSPTDGTEETATVTSNVPNSSVTLSKAYKTVTSYDNGTTDSSGNASIAFNISGASVGFTVAVTVSVGAATCQTSFTPV